MKTYHDLPTPAPDALKRSRALETIIQEKIQQHNNKISFADWMALALYHPDYGYYQQTDFELGKRGDFTTAPEISPLFAYCFARQCRQIFAELGHTTILELGAGSGRFALDLLTKLAVLQSLPERYYILEISASLRDKQRALIQAARPDLLQKVEWLTSMPATFSGVVIANEVLDALPFACFQIDTQHASERMVTVKDGEFCWELDAATTLIPAIEQLRVDYRLPDSYQSEILMPAMMLVRQLCEALEKGVILLADYGYGQREYYHPARNRGTLTCFYQHHAHDNPFAYPGLQDITAHVDFTRVIETADAYQGQLLGFTTQSAFLLANGLLDEAQTIENHLSEIEAFALHQAIKVLTMPMEMGDRIKIMAIGKQFSAPLDGFATLDRRRDL
jgi:SAM-dependent MidA family methyltransferase